MPPDKRAAVQLFQQSEREGVEYHCRLFRDLIVKKKLVDSDERHKVMELESFTHFLCVFPHYVGTENTSFCMIEEVIDCNEYMCCTQSSWETYNQYEGPKDTLVISCLSEDHFYMTEQEEYRERVISLQNKFEEENGYKPSTTYVVINITAWPRSFGYSLGMKDTYLLLLYDKGQADRYRHVIHGCLVLGSESVMSDMASSVVDINTMKKLVPPEMTDHDAFIKERFMVRDQ